MQTDFDSLVVSIDGHGVLTCTLNRPDKFNAITVQDMKDLDRLWSDVAEDKSVRAVIVTGAGDRFCAGGDITGMLNGEFNVKEITQTTVGTSCWKRFAALPQPTIAAINGTAAGVAIFFAGLADIVLSVDTAKFGDPHVKIGLVPPGAGIFAPSIGLRHIKFLFMTGEMIGAEEAFRIGLINRIVGADELMPEANRLAQQMSSYPQEALQWTKKCVNRLLFESWESLWDNELAYETMSASTQSHQDAVERFLKH